MNELINPSEEFISQIYFLRGQRVMLDADLAKVYGTTTARLNEQVKRNLKRFPPEFMFQLSQEEFTNLISQNATSSWGGRRKLPFAFTEHGAVMAASVLNTEAAVQASIYVVKAFVQMRNMVGMYKELEKRLSELEAHFGEQGGKIEVILEIFQRFAQQAENGPVVEEERRRIGYRRKEES